MQNRCTLSCGRAPFTQDDNINKRCKGLPDKYDTLNISDLGLVVFETIFLNFPIFFY